jgi:hypothetical protein
LQLDRANLGVSNLKQCVGRVKHISRRENVNSGQVRELVRHIQNILLLIGGTALGMGASAIALYLGMRSVLTEPRGESFGGAHIWVGLILCGGLLGAFLGFGISIRWIAQHESRIWGLPIWAGVVLGVWCGLFVSFNFLDRLLTWFWILCVAFIVPACGAAGGILGAVGSALFRRSAKPR